MSLLKVGVGVAANTDEASRPAASPADSFIPLLYAINGAADGMGPGMCHRLPGQHRVQGVAEIGLSSFRTLAAEVLHAIVDAPQVEDAPVRRQYRGLRRDGRA